MKMTNDVYEKLCDAIEKVLESHSLQEITKYRENVPYVKDQFTSFCWDIYRTSRFNCYEYDKTLNDSHILTALKRILEDFR